MPESKIQRKSPSLPHKLQVAAGAGGLADRDSDGQGVWAEDRVCTSDASWSVECGERLAGFAKRISELNSELDISQDDDAVCKDEIRKAVQRRVVVVAEEDIGDPRNERFPFNCSRNEVEMQKQVKGTLRREWCIGGCWWCRLVQGRKSKRESDPRVCCWSVLFRRV